MFSSRFQQNQETDVEIDMVPIMNMFLVLIPFLLISSSFLHLKAINTSIPTQGAPSELVEEDKPSEVKLTLLVSLKQDRIDVEISADELTETQKKSLAFSVPAQGKQLPDFNEFSLQVNKLKQGYPLSDTVLLTPDEMVSYEVIVKTMDAARGSEAAALFPHVVLSGILK
jgi:biopolymer transport protein ExbD